MDATCSQRVQCSKSEMKKRKKGDNEQLHKSKKLSNYRLFYSASSNFKEADIPKSMLHVIKDICTSNFSKFSFEFKCLCSEFRCNKHNLVFSFEFIFALIKQKST